jgi:tetraprenyl-beta-curcumene synthase
MKMRVPNNAITLMAKIYNNVIPQVHRELNEWKKRAEQIPNEELRKQALMSIDKKGFHCEGGSILAILALSHQTDCIRFIVAYQTISDYLDNLCDRSTSFDPTDFTSLHTSINHALSQNLDPFNYYQYRLDQDDGGYLYELVSTCQEILKKTKHLSKIQKPILDLAEIYCDLQTHKHVHIDERENRLTQWFEKHVSNIPEMHWYEFSACAGSTLGIFCLVAYAFCDNLNEEQIEGVLKGYFPYVQGLHILLDYFIDQEEDRLGGDLNFCSYYNSEDYMIKRFHHFITNADNQVIGIPNENFHRMIFQGLIGVYLSDQKVQQQIGMKELAKQIIKKAGFTAMFFYINGKMYRSIKSFVHHREQTTDSRQEQISYT